MTNKQKDVVTIWIIGTFGFVSAVEHRDNKDLVMVRARDRQSLDTMIQSIELAGNAINADGVKHKIEEDITPEASDKADYRWRVTISKATFALFVQFEILNYISYPNFKSALAKHRGNDFTRAAHRVWDDMQLVSDGPQVYGSVGKGGSRIAKKYDSYTGGYGGTYGSYGMGSYAGGGTSTNKKVGSTFFEHGSEEDKRDWENGYHGFNDPVEEDIDDSIFVTGEDIPELPEGADEWTDEQFEEWLDSQRTPMFLEPGATKDYPRTMSFQIWSNGIRGTQEDAVADFDETLAEGTWGPLTRTGDVVVVEKPQTDGTMYYTAEAVVDHQTPKAGDSYVVSVTSDSDKEPVLDFETAKKELKAITSKPTFQQKKQSKYAAKQSDR